MKLRRPAALAALAVALAACGSDPAEEPAPAPAPPAAAAPEPSPDERLAEDVRDALLQAPALVREDIRVAVSRGHVLLVGRVSAPHLRDEAVAVAGSVPGVEGVESKLAVGRAAR